MMGAVPRVFLTSLMVQPSLFLRQHAESGDTEA